MPVLAHHAFGLDPVDLAGQNATPEDITQVRSELGLDRPLLIRYWDWLSGAVTGNFGDSYSRRQPVSELIGTRLEPTLSLALVAIFFAVIIGVGFGVLATVHPRGVIDRFVSVISSIGIALPQFWVGMLLVMVFALQLGTMPATGYVRIGDGLAPWAAHVILPALALALMPAAELMRHVRSSVSEVMEKGFVLTARAKGIPTRSIYFRRPVQVAVPPRLWGVLGERLRVRNLLDSGAANPKANGQLAAAPADTAEHNASEVSPKRAIRPYCGSRHCNEARLHREQADWWWLSEPSVDLCGGADLVEGRRLLRRPGRCYRANQLPVTVVVSALASSIARRAEMLRPASGVLADRHFDPLAPDSIPAK